MSPAPRTYQRTPCSRDCPSCGEPIVHPLDAAICCLLAPPPTGWCAWCGCDLSSPRVFCTPACKASWFQDVFGLPRGEPTSETLLACRPTSRTCVATGGRAYV